MRKVIANGTVVTQENWHDASSRRIAQKPTDSSAIMYLYDGWNSVAVLNSSGALLETFRRGVGLARDIGTLVAITRHATAPSPGRLLVNNRRETSGWPMPSLQDSGQLSGMRYYKHPHP